MDYKPKKGDVWSINGNLYKVVDVLTKGFVVHSITPPKPLVFTLLFNNFKELSLSSDVFYLGNMKEESIIGLLYF